MPDRYKLYFGPYRKPRYNIGKTVECLARGRVTVAGTNQARIPWPVGRTQRAKSLVLYGDLAKAVRRESDQEIQHWWGVGSTAVWKWRKALGVKPPTIGESRLLSAYGKTPMGKRRMKAMHATLDDPARAAKISAAKLGIPRPQHVIEKSRRALTGRSVEPRASREVEGSEQATRSPAKSG